MCYLCFETLILFRHTHILLQMKCLIAKWVKIHIGQSEIIAIQALEMQRKYHKKIIDTIDDNRLYSSNSCKESVKKKCNECLKARLHVILLITVPHIWSVHTNRYIQSCLHVYIMYTRHVIIEMK